MKRSDNTISVIHRLVTDNNGENYWFEGCARYVMECLGEKDYDYWFFAGLTGDVFTQHYTYTKYSGDGLSSYRMAENPKQFVKEIFSKCGYDAVFVSGEELRQNTEKYLEQFLSYIDRGIPVMDWSQTDGVYVGYEAQGRTLLRIRGNSDQPERVLLEEAFEKSRGWAFVGEKKENPSLAEIYRNAVAEIPAYFAVRTDTYCFGPEAFRAWAADIENGKFDPMTAEEFDEWPYYTNYVCVLATNSGGCRGFLNKAKALNPDMDWLDKVVELYRRTGYMWNDESGEDLEAIGGGFNITLETLQNPERREKIAAKLREFAGVYDEIARVVKEGFASLKIQTKEEMNMSKINFNIPFSGFTDTNFSNCFTSVYMYLEKISAYPENMTFCNEWENGQCNNCGNCDTKPQALQEVYFFLFDTMCGHSSLRLRYDGTSTETEKEADNGSESSIEFLFGFTGYSYRTVKDPAAFRAEIAASIGADKPVIARLKGNVVPFAVITGYEGDAVICPDFRRAQKAPDPAVTYDNIAELYIIGEKGAPKYSLIDGLKRIEYVMGECLREDRWGGYMSKIGTYGPDSLGEDNTEGRKRRMKRLAETMWYTFNCHVFAQVFRTYRRDRPRFHPDLYDRVADVNRLDDPAFNELIHTISWRYGYTHDLAWSLIGLDECINWSDWKSHYYGDMLEVIIMKLKENDEAVLECIREMIRICENEDISPAVPTAG